jgi:hypothetical protein
VRKSAAANGPFGAEVLVDEGVQRAIHFELDAAGSPPSSPTKKPKREHDTDVDDNPIENTQLVDSAAAHAAALASIEERRKLIVCFLF